MMKLNVAACKAIDTSGGNRRLAEKLLPDGDSERLRRMEWAIAKWRKSGIPPSYVLDVEKITGVSRYELQPGVYGQPKQKRAHS